MSTGGSNTTFPLRLRNPDGVLLTLTVTQGMTVNDLYNHVLHSIDITPYLIDANENSSTASLPIIKLLAGFPPKELTIPEEPSPSTDNLPTIENILRPNEVVTLQPRYTIPSSSTAPSSPAQATNENTSSHPVPPPVVSPSSSTSRKRKLDGGTSEDPSHPALPSREIHNRSSKDKAKETIKDDIKIQEQFLKEQKKNSSSSRSSMTTATNRTPNSTSRTPKGSVMPGEGHRLGSTEIPSNDTPTTMDTVNPTVTLSPFSAFLSTGRTTNSSSSSSTIPPTTIASPSRNLLPHLTSSSSSSSSSSSLTDPHRLTGILTAVPNRTLLSSSSSNSSSSAVPSIHVPKFSQRRRTVNVGGSTESLGEMLARSGRGSSYSVHGDNTTEYLRAVSQMALQKQYEVTTANERLTAVQLGLYEITPVLTSRTLRTSAPAYLKIRFKPSNQVGWREETVDNVPAIVLPTLLRSLVNGDDAAREGLKPHVMSQAAPRTFWAVIRFGGASLRQEVPLPAMDQATPIGLPVDPLECIRALVPTGVDWSFLRVRTKWLTEKGQRLEQEKLRKGQRKPKKSTGSASTVIDLSNATDDEETPETMDEAVSGGGNVASTEAMTVDGPKVEPHHMILDSLALCHAAVSSLSVTLPVLHDHQRCVDAVCASAGMIEKIDICTSIHTTGGKSTQHAHPEMDEEFTIDEATYLTDTVRKLLTIVQPNSTAALSSSSSSSTATTMMMNAGSIDNDVSGDTLNPHGLVRITDYLATVRKWANPQPTFLPSVSVWKNLETLLSPVDADNDENEIEIRTYVCDDCGKNREVANTEANFDELDNQERWTCATSAIPRITQRGGCTAPDDDLCRIVDSEEIALALTLCGIPNIETLASCLLRDDDEVFYNDIEGALSTAFIQTIGRTSNSVNASSSSSSSSSTNTSNTVNDATNTMVIDNDPLRYQEISEHCRMLVSNDANAIIHPSLSASDMSSSSSSVWTLNQWYDCLRDRLLGALMAFIIIPVTALRMEEQRSFGSYQPRLLLYRQRSYQLLLAMALLLLFPYQKPSEPTTSLSSSSTKEAIPMMIQHYVESFTKHRYLLHAFLRHPVGYLSSSQLAHYFLGFARADAMDEYMARIFDYAYWLPTVEDETMALNLLHKPADNASASANNDRGIRRYYAHLVSQGTEEETIEETHDKLVEKLRTVLDKVGLRTVADLASIDSLVLFSALREAHLTNLDNNSNVTVSTITTIDNVPNIITLTDVLYWQRTCRTLISNEPWLAELLTI